MKTPRLVLACLVSAALVVGLPACLSGGTGKPTGAGGAATFTGGAPAGGGGAAAETGGVIGTGGITGSGGMSSAGGVGGATVGTGGIPGTGGMTGGSGGTTSSTATAPGGAGGNTGGALSTGGTTAGKGGATSTGGGTSAAGLTVYYIRHAEVVANVIDPSQITIENADELTDLGNRQVEALTTYLQGLGITPDAILVSPHLRAQRTIGPYLVAKNLSGEVWMELAEASDKDSTGAPVPAEPKYIKFYKATIEVENLVFRDPAHIEFWQNDNYESGLLMVMTARDLVLERYSRSGKTIIVVGHAIAGQLLVGLLRGDDLINGPPTTGSAAVFIYNTGVMRMAQDPSTGLFKLDGRNINNPATK